MRFKEKISINDFKLISVLGRGSFGKVKITKKIFIIGSFM